MIITMDKFATEFLTTDEQRCSLYFRDPSLDGTLKECFSAKFLTTTVFYELPLPSSPPHSSCGHYAVLETSPAQPYPLQMIRGIATGYSLERVFLASPCSPSLNNPAEIIPLDLQVSTWTISGAYLDFTTLNEKLVIRRSKIHGFGVFTDEALDDSETLFHLTGDLISFETLSQRGYSGEWNALSKDKALFRAKKTTYGFINHSRYPNCYIDRHRLTVVTSRRIECGEELFLDYTLEPLPEAYLKGHGSTYL
jgi:hypothetical protein